MRNVFLLLSALTVVSCGRGDNEVAPDSPAAAAIPGALSFADLVGRWSIRLLDENGDSVLATYELNATADTTSWTITPVGHEPVPLRATVDGDSLLIDAGPYKAMTPANVNMTTHGVSRLEGEELVGTYVSQFALPGGDSVTRGRLRGTRLP
jgi:hypothetical protein